MSIVQINQIETRVGTVIPSISGTIASVFPPKSGKGQHGNWKLQNIKIQDVTGSCQVTLSSIDQDLNESHVGKNIEFESVGTKFGLKGVSCEKRDYVDKKGNNVSSIGVKVTKTAKIRLEGAGMVQEDAKDDITMSFEKNKEGEPVEYITPHTPIKYPSKSPQERIAQYRMLYEHCWDQARMVDDTFEVGLIKDICTTFFIQACKEGLGDKMYVKQPF